MAETRNFVCQVTGEVLGTFTLPDRTPEAVWERTLARLSASHIVTRPEVITQYQERIAIQREIRLHDAIDVLRDVTERDRDHTAQRIREAVDALEVAAAELVAVVRDGSISNPRPIDPKDPLPIPLPDPRLP